MVQRLRLRGQRPTPRHPFHFTYFTDSPLDPVTHTLFGSALAAGGLRRTTALAAPTLIVAANAPDVDVITLAAGPYTSLALRRGLTHGLPALLVLPLVVAGAVLLWDRWVRLRRRPDAAPARPVPLLGLAALGVWSHPALDWLNTYGMRWLLPFDGRWSYGDAVFIVDPWLWLLLGGASFMAYSATRRARVLWGVLAGVLSLPVLLVEGLPGWIRVLWVAGLAGIVALRWFGRVRGPVVREPGPMVHDPVPGAPQESSAPPAARGHPAPTSRLLLALAVLYVVAMVGQTQAAEAVVADEAEARGLGPVTDVMVGPVPADPLAGQVIVKTDEAYWTGDFRWTASPRVRWAESPLPRLDGAPDTSVDRSPARSMGGTPQVIQAARAHPDAARYLTWARFPLYELEDEGQGDGGWRVRIRDVRYLGRGAGGLGGIEVRVSPELDAVEAGPVGGRLSETRRTGSTLLRPRVDGVTSVARAAPVVGAAPVTRAAPVTGAPPMADSALHAATFDTVWTRIRDTHYDPDIRGLDWAGLRDELRPRAAEAEDAEALRGILRELLGHLGDSHFVILPSGSPDPEAVGGGGGVPGLEVRWVDETALVTRVREGGPAYAAGLRPGHLLLAVDDTPVEEVLEEYLAGLPVETADPDADPDAETDSDPDADPDPAARAGLPPSWTDALLDGWLQGEPGQERELSFLDEADRVRSASLRLETPPGQVVRFGNLPPFNLEVEDRPLRLTDGREAGLIRFTGWFPQIVPEVAAAVDRYRHAHGIVLDLRGNPGGVGGLVMGIGGHFLDERVELGTMRTRETELRFVVNPQRIGPDGTRVRPFQGPLAILVDSRSASTSELFAGGMQAVGRARVFGERTAGQVLPAALADLPNGDRLMYAVADFTAPDGSRLEGRGVRPDELIRPSRPALLTENDPVLARALEWIARTSNPNEDSLP